MSRAERRHSYPKTSTPWGPSQIAYHYGTGVIFYSTAGHGGFHLSKSLNAAVPDYMRAESGWYEEDEAWSIVAVNFPKLFSPDEIHSALDTLRNWYPAVYERFTGTVLKPGESFCKDEDDFKSAHANDYLVLSAHGSHRPGVPEGMIAVFGGRGGRDNGRFPEDTKWFLVPAAEYQNPGRLVLDPARYAEIAPLS